MSATAKGPSAVGEAARLVLILWGSVAAAAELYHRGILSQTHDTPIHLYRLMDFSQLFEAGQIFPRLAPTLALGYGYATFTYYPPAAVYIGEAFHLFGLGFIASLKASFAVGILLGGFGMYLLARDIYGQWGATAAALAYAYVPYRLVTIYAQGDIAESLALGMLPLALWAAIRVCDRPTPGRIAFGGAAIAGLILSHALTTVIAAPLFAGIITIRSVRPQLRASPDGQSLRRPTLYWPTISRKFLAVGLTGVLAGAVSAVYWTPVFVGMRHLNSAALIEGFFDFHHWFIPVNQLVQMDWPYDYQQIYEEGLRFNVGRVQAMIVIISSLWLILGRPKQRLILTFCVCLAIILVWMQQDGSAAIWERAPTLQFIQFPYRLEGSLGVVTALLLGSLWSTGHGVRTTERIRITLKTIAGPTIGFIGKVVGVTALVVLVNTSLVHLPRGHGALPEANVNAPTVWRLEIYRKLIGGNTQGDYLPETSRGDIFALTAASGNESSVRAAPRLTALDFQPFQLIATTTAKSPTTITLDRFAYPGWLASIDGQAVPTKPDGPLGLVAIDLPAGDHRLAVWYDGASGDGAGIVLALCGIASICVVATAPWRRGFWYRAGFVALSFLLVAALLSARFHPPRRLEANADFGGAARLVGASVDQSSGPSPEVVKLNLLWEGLSQTDAGCTVRVRLLDANGKVVAFRDKAPQFGLRPCDAWRTGEIVHDLEEIRLPPGAVAGTYRLAVGLTVGGIDLAPTSSASVATWHESAERGGLVRSGIDLGNVTVSAAPAEARLDGSTPVGATVGTTYQIVSARIQPLVPAAEPLRPDTRFVARLGPDERLSVDVLWRALADVDSDAAVFTQLLDANAQLVAQDDGWPDHWNSPTSTWYPGDTLVDRRILAPKGSLAPGLYRVAVGLYDQATMQRQPAEGPGADHDQVVLGTVKVSNSEHIFGRPVVLPPRQAELSQQIRVIGVGVENNRLHPSDTARVHVSWQAIVQPPRDYTVFVHLMSKDGHLRAQHDGPPLGGTFPTSAWDTGDTVFDSIDLQLPDSLTSGDYDIVLGMYRPDTGARLADVNGVDTVSVATVAVQ